MKERSFREDLRGSDESLDDLLTRLKAQLSRPRTHPRRNPPKDFGHVVSSRRPRGGAGGAEAPLPKPDRGLADCHAP